MRNPKPVNRNEVERSAFDEMTCDSDHPRFTSRGARADMDAGLPPQPERQRQAEQLRRGRMTEGLSRRHRTGIGRADCPRVIGRRHPDAPKGNRQIARSGARSADSPLTPFLHTERTPLKVTGKRRRSSHAHIVPDSGRSLPTLSTTAGESPVLATFIARNSPRVATRALVWPWSTMGR